jgi:hypothetical protein
VITLTARGFEAWNPSSSGYSIIQGSAAGPASYVVMSSDLRPLTVGNSMVKFADDNYLVIPASNCGSCAEEINHVGDWASSNNLCLNHAKSWRSFSCHLEVDEPS